MKDFRQTSRRIPLAHSALGSLIPMMPREICGKTVKKFVKSKTWLVDQFELHRCHFPVLN